MILEKKRKRGRASGRGERERQGEICCSTPLCIHRLLLDVPWPGIKPSTFVYRDDALTNRATRPGHWWYCFKVCCFKNPALRFFCVQSRLGQYLTHTWLLYKKCEGKKWKFMQHEVHYFTYCLLSYLTTQLVILFSCIRKNCK